MSNRPIRRLTELLGLLDRGRFEAACDAALCEALETLGDLPKEKGTAKITVELQIVFDQGRVDVQPTLKSKLPEDKAFGRTPFWASEGALSTQHPSQVDMFVRDAAAAEPEAEEAAG